MTSVIEEAQGFSVAVATAIGLVRRRVLDGSIQLVDAEFDGYLNEINHWHGRLREACRRDLEYALRTA